MMEAGAIKYTVAIKRVLDDSYCVLDIHCNTLQHTATHCNTLQHTATHCNTLQHTTTNVYWVTATMYSIYTTHKQSESVPRI